MNGLFNFDFGSVVVGLFTELLIVVVGYLLGATIIRWYKNWRYGGWHTYLLNPNDEPILDRPLSAATAERVLQDEAEMNVYLKGLISPFGRIHCDLVTQLEKPNPELIRLDKDGRAITVRLVEPFITPEGYEGESPAAAANPVT